MSTKKSSMQEKSRFAAVCPSLWPLKPTKLTIKDLKPPVIVNFVYLWRLSLYGVKRRIFYNYLPRKLKKRKKSLDVLKQNWYYPVNVYLFFNHLERVIIGC